MNRFVLAAVLASATFLGGCGAPRSHQSKVLAATPKWYSQATDVERDKGPTFLIGKGAGVSTSQQVAIDMARMRALVGVGQQVETAISNYSKSALEQTGEFGGETVTHFSAASTAIMADMKVSGARVRQQVMTAVDDTYYCWILMDYPLADVNAKALADLQKAKATYERFRATQLYGEMNKELDKYREFQKNEKPKT